MIAEASKEKEHGILWPLGTRVGQAASPRIGSEKQELLSRQDFYFTFKRMGYEWL